MRFEKDMGVDYEKWSLEDWIADYINEPHELFRHLTDFYQNRYAPPRRSLKNWEVKDHRAYNIVMRGAVMAEGLGREVER